MKFKYAIYLCLIFFSCNNKSNYQLIKKDSLVWKDLHFLSGKIADDYNYISFMTKKLQAVDSLDKGIDGNAIRLWFEYPNYDNLNKKMVEDILTIRNIGLDNPTIEVITVTRGFDSVGNVNEFIETSPKNLGTPKCGWQKFKDTIIYFKISNLPDVQNSSNNLNNYGVSLVLCEIAESNFYRVISYVEPKANENNSWECHNFNQFILFIERQFNFKRIIEY